MDIFTIFLKIEGGARLMLFDRIRSASAINLQLDDLFR